MTHTRLASIVTLLFVTGVSGSASAASPTSSQLSSSQTQTSATASLQGAVTDDRGHAVAGALVSVTGEQKAVAVTDGAGRFVFAGLSPGPYIVRVHQRGYAPVRALLVQAATGTTQVPTLRLVDTSAARLLTAGAGDPSAAVPDAPAPDQSELAWRLRHARRGALDDVAVAARAVDQPADGHHQPRIPALPLSGEFNLLTTASFDRPQDLFANRLVPNGLAYLAIGSAAPGGEWRMRGTLTQGDLSAWMASGSYTRAASAIHAYESGASFARQRYDGGNAAALAAVGDGGRVAGSLHAFDHWRVGPAVLSYGGRYDRYDYLQSRGLFSPSASVSVNAGRGLRAHASVSQVRRAPGAEEFSVPEAFGLGVTPVRTFSSLAGDGSFRPEMVRSVDAGAEQSLAGLVTVGARVFAQRVGDQMVAIFGVDRQGGALSRMGHYFVGGAGDYTAHGVAVSAHRDLGAYVTGSVEYSTAKANWTAMSQERAALGSLAAVAVRAARERVGDLRTAVNAEIPLTATRVIVVYRLLQSSAADDAAAPLSAARFDVQVQQTLPFLRFTNAQWSALVALQNQARDAQFDQSAYDELLAVQSPTRLVGGLTIRF